MVGVSCSVIHCKNTSSKCSYLSFHAFPSDKKLKKKWKTFCQRSDDVFKRLKRPRICSAHFDSRDIKKSLTGKVFVKPSCLPAIFRPQCNSDASPREKRRENRKRKLEEDVVVEDCKLICSPMVSSVAIGFTSKLINIDVEAIESEHNYYSKTQDREKCTQVNFDMEELSQVKKELDELKKENEALRSKLKNKSELKRELFAEDVLKNDVSVKFYTGLPSLVCLMTIFNLIKPLCRDMKYWDHNKNRKVGYQKNPTKSKPGRKRTLTLFQEFIMTLVKIRLGLLNIQLSHMYGISTSSVSKIFRTWSRFLAKILKDTLLVWPKKSDIRKNLPRTFNNFPSTRIIIDCTEVFIEKPTSPSAQRATWSSYKHHNTMKTLVGITPNGMFSFVSKLWTGNTSDRRITENCGLLELLEPGDSVMADKGFNIKDLLTKLKVELNTPPLCKGKQLSSKAVKSTRKIASVRIHVERAIERLKNFRILQGNIPLTLIDVADSILIICASICNLLPPLAK